MKYAGVRHIVPWASPVGAGARSASSTSALFVTGTVVPPQVSACSFRISCRHIPPNVLAPVIVQASLYLSYAIAIPAEPALSFLGVDARQGKGFDVPFRVGIDLAWGSHYGSHVWVQWVWRCVARCARRLADRHIGEG